MVRLFVRDVSTGTVHELGTDVHDSLIRNDDGSLSYYNLQNGCGTADEYEFCLPDGDEPDPMYDSSVWFSGMRII